MEWDISPANDSNWAGAEDGYSFVELAFKLERHSDYYETTVMTRVYLLTGLGYCSFFLSRAAVPPPRGPPRGPSAHRRVRRGPRRVRAARAHGARRRARTAGPARTAASLATQVPARIALVVISFLALCNLLSSVLGSLPKLSGYARLQVESAVLGAAQLAEAAFATRALMALGGSPRSRGATELVGVLSATPLWP